VEGAGSKQDKRCQVETPKVLLACHLDLTLALSVQVTEFQGLISSIVTGQENAAQSWALEQIAGEAGECMRDAPAVPWSVHFIERRRAERGAAWHG
jgi:hypothetical protein